MRPLLLLTFAVTAAAAGAPPAGPVTLAQLEVPRDHGPQRVVVQSRDFAAHSESGWHVHPGVEIGVVIAGALELRTAAGVLTLEPGDSFTVPRGVAHNGVNRGDAGAQLMITLVVDKDAPLRTTVAPPPAR